MMPNQSKQAHYVGRDFEGAVSIKSSVRFYCPSAKQTGLELEYNVRRPLHEVPHKLSNTSFPVAINHRPPNRTNAESGTRASTNLKQIHYTNVDWLVSSPQPALVVSGDRDQDVQGMMGRKEFVSMIPRAQRGFPSSSCFHLSNHPDECLCL